MIESEIVKCDKIVYIAKSPRLLAEYDYYVKRYYWLKFQKGSEIFVPEPIG